MNRETLQQIVTGIIHEGKQTPDSGDVVLVTAKRIGTISHNGTLDFGGSEYTEGPVEWIEPKKKDEGDDYGWWMLDEDNESLQPTSDTRCYLQIWDAAARNGLSQPFQVITDRRAPLHATVRVGKAGIGIKENARISVVGAL